MLSANRAAAKNHRQDADATLESHASLESFFGADLINQIRPLGLANLHWAERRHYSFDCNWKVFVDNYLDGGYHVPHLHKGLDSVLDYSNYMIENGERFCLQWSPMVSRGRRVSDRRGAQRRAGALLLDLSELHDQLLRRRDGYKPRHSARRR